MRTTMNLPDALVADVKARAANAGRTLTSVVEEALRALLRSDQDRETDADREPLPSYGRPDGRFLVDLEDRDAVWAILDGAR